MQNISKSIAVLLLFVYYTGSFAQVPSFTVLVNNNPFPGYLYLASMHFNGSHPNYLLILDKDGNMVYNKTLHPNFDGNYTDFKPQPENRYSFFSPKNKCYFIMDYKFEIIDSLFAANSYSTDNHELLITEKNHYLIMALEERTINMTQFVSGGDSAASVTGIIVQEFDSTKTLLFEWKTLDAQPIISECKGQNLLASKIDYVHSNSLFIDTDTSFLISHRHFNEITKVNRKNGNIIWRMGKNADANQFTFVNDSMGFSYQHFAQRLANGNITLFDNGNFRPNGYKVSRACEYKIDEANKVATLVWEYTNPTNNIGFAMGSVQRLPGGNTLIGWGSSYPNVTEVDSLGNKVFELTFVPNSTVYTYRAYKFDGEIPGLVGIEKYVSSQNKDALIYPNPATDLLAVNYPGLQTIFIHNAEGKDVSQKAIAQMKKDGRAILDISKLPPGIYLITLISEEGVSITQRFLKTL